MGNERYLLFGIESFSSILDQFFPNDEHVTKFVEKLEAKTVPQESMAQGISTLANIIFDTILSEEDLREHVEKQLLRVANQQFIFTSDFNAPCKLQMINKSPYISTQKPTDDDFDTLPIVSISPNFLSKYIGGSRILIDALFKEEIKINKVTQFDTAFTRVILTLAAIFHTRKHLRDKVAVQISELFKNL